MQKCPECGSMLGGAVSRCEFCGYRFSPESAAANAGRKRSSRSRPWVLSEVLFLRIGFNGLGAIEFGLAFLPVIIWTAIDRPFDNSSRVLALVAAIAATALDVWWRATNYDAAGWRKAFSPVEGGALLLVPGWLVGVGLIAFDISAFVIRTVPEPVG